MPIHLDVTQRIEENLAELQKTLPADVKLDTKIFSQADFIETSVNNVQNALIEGGIFVIIILFLFLGSFRTTIISLLAIPLIIAWGNNGYENAGNEYQYHESGWYGNCHRLTG